VYHPESANLVKRFVKTIGQKLSCIGANKHNLREGKLKQVTSILNRIQTELLYYLYKIYSRGTAMENTSYE
jgi:hypothetical protein